MSISEDIVCGAKVVQLVNAAESSDNAANATKETMCLLGGVLGAARRYEPKSAMVAKSNRSKKR